MTPSFVAWAGLIGAIVALLLVDLLVLHRGTVEISVRDAAWSTAGFVAVGVLFGVALGTIESGAASQEFFVGYALEWSLSLDNVFVWALIFSAFGVPAAYQRRVLFYGIFGALLLRGAFVAAGSELLKRFEWGRLRIRRDAAPQRYPRAGGPERTRHGEQPHPERAPPPPPDDSGLRRISPDRPRAGHRPRQPTRRAADPASLVPDADGRRARGHRVDRHHLRVRLDPGDLGVTREPYIVFAATAFALVGRRSMYFLLAGARERFVHLDTGVAVILVFIGAEFLLTGLLEVGPLVSLGVIVMVMSGAIGASLAHDATGTVRGPGDDDDGVSGLHAGDRDS